MPDLTPQNVLLIGLAIATASSFVYAYVAKKKGNRAAKVALCLGGALKKAATEALDKKKVDLDVVVDLAYEFAAEMNVPDEHLEQHLPPGAGSSSSPTPPPAASPAAS